MPRQSPQRLPYHLLALTTAGHGTVEVDFESRPCRPGTLLWIRPGQALRFGGQPGLDAAIVVWERDLLPAEDVAGVDVDDPAGPARWQLAGEDEDAVISEFTQLAVDCDRHSAGAESRPGRTPQSPPHSCVTSSPSCCCGSRCSPPTTRRPRPPRRAGRSPGSAASLEERASAQPAGGGLRGPSSAARCGR